MRNTVCGLRTESCSETDSSEKQPGPPGRPSSAEGEKQKFKGLAFKKTCGEQKRLAYLSAQANSSLGEVLSLLLKVSLLLFEEPPLLFEALLLLQRVAVVKESCRLVVKG